MVHVVQRKEKRLGCLSGPGRGLLPWDSICSMTTPLPNGTWTIQPSLHKVSSTHALDGGDGLSAVCSVCPSAPDSALSRPRKRVARDFCPLPPAKAVPLYLKPYYFTWTLNFFCSNPQLLNILRTDVYLPRSSKTVILKTPGSGRLPNFKALSRDLDVVHLPSCSLLLCPILYSLGTGSLSDHLPSLSLPLCPILYSLGTGNLSDHLPSHSHSALYCTLWTQGASQSLCSCVLIILHKIHDLPGISSPCAPRDSPVILSAVWLSPSPMPVQGRV